MENLIGKIVHTNQAALSAEQSAWAWVLKKMPAVVEAYETIGLGAFDNEIFTLLKNRQRSTIESRAEKQLEEETKGFKIPIIRNSARENLYIMLNLLYEAWESVENTKNSSGFNPIYEVRLNWDEVSYQEGAFVVDPAPCSKRNNITIENEGEAQLYQLMLDTKQAFDKLGAFLKARGIESRQFQIINHNGGLVYESANELNIRPEGIKILERMERYTKSKQY